MCVCVCHEAFGPLLFGSAGEHLQASCLDLLHITVCAAHYQQCVSVGTRDLRVSCPPPTSRHSLVVALQVYMCQFPFDLDRFVDAPHVQAFSSYDTVLLNSLYSLKWYQRFIAPVLQQALTTGMLFPNFEVRGQPLLCVQAAFTRTQLAVFDPGS